jgi:hypothetical protein
MVRCGFQRDMWDLLALRWLHDYGVTSDGGYGKAPKGNPGIQLVYSLEGIGIRRDSGAHMAGKSTDVSIMVPQGFHNSVPLSVTKACFKCNLLKGQIAATTPRGSR